MFYRLTKVNSGQVVYFKTKKELMEVIGRMDILNDPVTITIETCMFD